MIQRQESTRAARPIRQILLPALLVLALTACGTGEDQAPVTTGPAATERAAPSTGAPTEGASAPAETAAPTPGAAAGPVPIELREAATGLASPIGLVNAADGSERLFAVEQGGTVRAISVDADTGEASVSADPFLDISDRVTAGGEQGLLGLAFHPDFEENRRLFAHFTDLDGNTVIAEYTATETGDAADPQSERVVLRVEQPFPNHNGGMIAFGPDGYLYIALGDGGGANDPLGTGQDTSDLLGSILRLDVDTSSGGEQAYAIPDDNPFVSDGGAPEVWDYGLRNPWRFSFDRETGDLYIGDVGQGSWEEIDLHAAGEQGGLNFGWNLTEGAHCFRTDPCDDPALTGPIAEYPLPDGHCAVIGGYVYRGERHPALQGTYLYGDHCSGAVWGLETGGESTEPAVVLESGLRLSSFGEDEAGELYAVDLGSGTLYAVDLP